MNKLAHWWLVHALHWAVLYGAFIANIAGAMYVLKFCVWLMAPVSLLLLADKPTAEAAKQPARPVLRWLSTFQAWVTLGMLVWFGHIASALAWGLVMVMFALHHDAIRKARAAAATTAA